MGTLRRKQKRKKRPPTYVRPLMNTDPHWVNWEYLAAFGEDERGYTYLAAIKQHCCIRNDDDEWLENLVRHARKSCEGAGLGDRGRNAAWRVFRQAGMILLHDLMNDLVTGEKKCNRAVFHSIRSGQTVIVRRDWKMIVVYFAEEIGK